MSVDSKPDTNSPQQLTALNSLTRHRASHPMPASFVETLHAMLARLDILDELLLLPGPPPEPPALRSSHTANSPELSSAVQEFSQVMANCIADPSPTPHQMQAVANSFERIVLQLLAENGYDLHASD